jgi:hypothetical protein
MFPSDPTFNELHIRERQLVLGQIMLDLKDLADIFEGDDQNGIVDNIIDLISIDECLSYFVNYERSANAQLNQARLQNAKQRLEIQGLKDELTHLQKSLDNAAERL